MKKCVKCGVPESTYLVADQFKQINGEDYCPYCFDKIDQSKNEGSEDWNKNIFTYNKIGDALHLIGYGVIAIGLLLSVFVMTQNLILGILFAVMLVIFGIVILGIAEIIFLQENILRRLDNVENEKK